MEPASVVVEAQEARRAGSKRRGVSEPSEMGRQDANFRHVRDHHDDLVVGRVIEWGERLCGRAFITRQRSVHVDRTIETGLGPITQPRVKTVEMETTVILSDRGSVIYAIPGKESRDEGHAILMTVKKVKADDLSSLK